MKTIRLRKTVNDLALAGIGLVYSELQEVIEFACNHKEEQENGS